MTAGSVTAQFFGTTAEQRIAELRHEAVRTAARHLGVGDRGDGALRLLRSTVEHQAFIAGIDIDLPPVNLAAAST
jgi:hypothetical protein